MIDTWEAWVDRVEDDPRNALARGLIDLVAEGERVVELGCGGGTRETRELAARYRAHGRRSVVGAARARTRAGARGRVRPGRLHAHRARAGVARRRWRPSTPSTTCRASCSRRALRTRPRRGSGRAGRCSRRSGSATRRSGTETSSARRSFFSSFPAETNSQTGSRGRVRVAPGRDRHDSRARRACRVPVDPGGTPVSCDFSLDHYRDLLRAAQAGGYRWAGFDRAPEPGDLLLRHDVDLSLAAALAVAEVEADEGAWSTWFLMTRSVFYNLDSQRGRGSGRAAARARAIASRTTPSGRTSISTRGSTRSSRGTTPSRSSCRPRSRAP